MTKEEIAVLMQSNHKLFIELQSSLTESQFETSNNGKWNPGQELDHIIRAVRPVVLAFSLPSFILKLLFGKANRPSKTYQGLVDKYNTKLAQGGRAIGRFIPDETKFRNREAALKKLDSLITRLNRRTIAKSEHVLDQFILPHPLLGKVTLREMLYFTAYHVEHHRKNTLRNLDAATTPR